MDLHNLMVKLSFISLLILIVFSFAVSDEAKEREECSQQLLGLQSCLPYVGGNAQAPTPDCCSGIKQMLRTNKKCLCMVIKDRNDPDLGLSINVTLALGLPSVCHAPANVTQCPAVLQLPPNSTEAQAFYHFGQEPNDTASSPAVSVKPNSTSADGSGTGSKTGTGSGTETGRTTPTTSDGCQSGKRWLGLEFIAGGVLLMWYCTSNFFRSHVKHEYFIYIDIFKRYLLDA